jgi:hypothetical protein
MAASDVALGLACRDRHSTRGCCSNSKFADPACVDCPAEADCDLDLYFGIDCLIENRSSVELRHLAAMVGSERRGEATTTETKNY